MIKIVSMMNGIQTCLLFYIGNETGRNSFVNHDSIHVVERLVISTKKTLNWLFMNRLTNIFL